MDLHEIEELKSRLAAFPRAFTEIDFTPMPQKSVREARLHGHLDEPFLSSVEKHSPEGDLAPVIDIGDPTANQLVEVFRMLELNQPLKDFEPEESEECFVTHRMEWTFPYGGDRGRDVLLRFILPAMILEIDRSTNRQEPYYVVSRTRLRDLGVPSFKIFLVQLAVVNPGRSLVWLSPSDRPGQLSLQ